jgi:hypothetical protein
MSPAEAALYYGLPTRGNSKKVQELQNAERQAFLEDLRARGLSPIVANFDKAREGTTPGKWATEFDYHRFTFQPIEPGRYSADVNDDDADGSGGRREGGEGLAGPARVRVGAEPAATPAKLTKMLEAVGKNPESSQTVLAREAGLSNGLAKIALATLIERGQVEMVGEGRGTRYRQAGSAEDRSRKEGTRSRKKDAARKKQPA